MRTECLAHFPVLGGAHLRRQVTEFVGHDAAGRPHPARGNVPLPDADREETPILKCPGGEARCRRRLGGFLKHYHRAAA